MEYSLRYRGMTPERKNNLRMGAGAEYRCSEQGASLLREMGMMFALAASC